MMEGLPSGKFKDNYQKEIKKVRNAATNKATYERCCSAEKRTADNG
jgi:hypothetical protein